MGSLVYDDHLDLARSQSLNRDWTFPTAPTTVRDLSTILPTQEPIQHNLSVPGFSC
jgi:hypothetical protein